MTAKWEAKKEPLYKPSNRVPEIVEVPPMKFAVLSGTGNPNTSEDFASCVEALYSVSYGIKMFPKSGEIPPGYFEYTVAPLEGIWDVAGGDYDVTKKDKLIWTIMIRQPLFVDAGLFARAAEAAARKKKNNPRIPDLAFEEITEGPCCQFLHIGPFDQEPESFARMAEFVNENGYRRSEMTHHEIYLSDFRKVAPEKLRTILRFRVEEAG